VWGWHSGESSLYPLGLSKTPATPLYLATWLWIGLLFAGQSALLAFTRAGNRSHFQHLDLEHIGNHTLALAALAVQALLVVAGVWRIGSPLRGVRLAALAVLMTAFSAVPSRDLSFYAWELAMAGSIACIQLGNLWLAAASLPERLRESLSRWPESVFAKRGGRAVWLCAAVVAFTAGVLNLTVYDNFPHIADELAFLLQGRIFAEGQLTIAPPAVPAAFPLDLFVQGTREWYPCTLPGYPLLLALGFLVNAPWLVNALLAGANILLAQRLLLRLLDPGQASMATLLLAVSPWNLFLAMSFMGHTAALTFLLLMLLGMVRALREGRSTMLLLSGLALGMLWSIRMLDGSAVAVAAGLFLLVRTRRLGPAIAFAAGFLPVVLAMLTYNARLTGNAFYSPLSLYFDSVYHPGINSLGFGPNRGLHWPFDPFPGHGPADAAVNTVLNLFQLNTELYAWAGGSLALLVFCLLQRRWERADWCLLGLAAFLPAVYLFYWFSGGPDFGPRYWHLSILPLAVWTARLLHGQGLNAVALIAMSVAVVTFVPWRAMDKYTGYLDMRPDLREMRFYADGPALVLVRGRVHPSFSAAAYLNQLDFQGPVVYAWDSDERTREALLAAYPGRRVFTVEGPDTTGKGYRVLRAEGARK